MFILEAKLGMDESYQILGEYDTYPEARRAQQQYEYDQISSDLIADSHIVNVNELMN